MVCAQTATIELHQLLQYHMVGGLRATETFVFTEVMVLGWGILIVIKAEDDVNCWRLVADKPICHDLSRFLYGDTTVCSTLNIDSWTHDEPYVSLIHTIWYESI